VTGSVLAYVALGANLGDARAMLRWAVTQLAGLPQTRLRQSSHLYVSAPVDAAGPDFVNAVSALQTGLGAPDLLHELQKLEQKGGRERPYRNAPRTLDLDLLLYGDTLIDSPALQVPHPRMWQRAFVLLPLAELDPQRVSLAQLQQVAHQPIRRLEDENWL